MKKNSTITLQPKLNKIFFFFMFLLLVLCVRLIHLQVHLAKKLYMQGQRNFLRINKVTPTRGNILDINGKLLATNKPVHNLYWIGQGRPKLNEQDLQDLYLLEKILNDQNENLTESESPFSQNFMINKEFNGQASGVSGQIPFMYSQNTPKFLSNNPTNANCATCEHESKQNAQTKDQKNMQKYVNNKISITDPENLEKIRIANKYNKKILLASELTFDQLSKIEEQFCKSSSIKIETSFKRFYPYQSFASHTLGFLGRMDIDNIGKMGLEKLLEESLKGKDGAVEVKINSFGTKLSETIVANSLSGENIKINLDIELQEIIENAFPDDSTGSFILMNPCDGSILGLLSRPNFDPNIFLNPISQDEWAGLQENNPFQNRAFNAAYPPGSIFKIVTISFALENKIVNQNDTCHCCGYLTFAGRKYHCHDHDGHGLLTLSQAFEKSCDIPFYKIAKKMDIDKLANYANRFGLGQKTNIIFPEKLGNIPTKAWKKKNKGERWYTGESLSAAIGQGFITVTPMQAARMVSSVFTGYLVNPRILEQEPVIKEPLNISNATLKFLRQSMKKVVTQGTGQRINRKKDFEIYAKTGTAQTSDLTKSELGEKIYREHRWLVGTFKYKNNSPITFVVLIEHALSPMQAKEAVGKLLTGYEKLAIKREREAISGVNENLDPDATEENL